MYPFIILGGALQTCGAAMNAQLFQSLGNKWLANAVSFAPILAFFLCVFAMFPHPLPALDSLLKIVRRVGAGAFVGLTATAAPVMSLLLDPYGWFHMPVHSIDPWRVLGALFMAAGIVLIAKH